MELTDEQYEELERGAAEAYKALGRELHINTEGKAINSVRAGAVSEDGKRIAWMEEEGEGGNYTFCLRVNGKDLRYSMDAYSYNTFFGIYVKYFRWMGDKLVMIYDEKHRSIVMVANGEAKPKIVSLEDNWLVKDDFVRCREWYNPDLHFCRAIPSLMAVLPVPSDMDPVHAAFSGSDPWRFARDMKSAITAAFADHPYFEVLIGSWLYPFWQQPQDPFEDYDTLWEKTSGKWNSPNWFPYYFAYSLKAEEKNGFIEMLHNIIDHETGNGHPYRWILSYMKIKAQRVLGAFESARFPGDMKCHLWVEWSVKGMMDDLGSFPPAFGEAFKELAKDRNVWLNMSKSLNGEIS